MFRIMAISAILSLGCPALFAQATNELAPGGPGNDAHWPSAAKNGFGTSNTLQSKVWFTLNNGVLTEAFYPRLDVPNVQSLQLIIVGAKVETESEDTIHRFEVVDSRALLFRQINTAKSGNYAITKTYVTDPQRSTILIQIDYSSRTANRLYVYYDPSLNNSGLHDSAWNEGEALLSQDGDKASALISDSGFARADEGFRDWIKPSERSAGLEISNGYLGTSDGLSELKEELEQLFIYSISPCCKRQCCPGSGFEKIARFQRRSCQTTHPGARLWKNAERGTYQCASFAAKRIFAN